MNRSRLLSALIALLAITSLSVASTTLETSLTTDPDDEINPDWDTLPIGQDDAAAIQESIESGGEESAGGAGSGSADGAGSAVDEPSLFDRLIALLSRLFRLLLPIAAIAAAALAYRYREALIDFFGRDSRTTPATEPRSAAGHWPGTTPEHDVDRAWVEVIRRLNPDRPETTTRTSAGRSLAFEAPIATPSSRSSPRSSACTTAAARSTRRSTGLAKASAR